MVKWGELGTGLAAGEVDRLCPHVVSSVPAPWGQAWQTALSTSVLSASERVSPWAQVSLPEAGSEGLPTAVRLLPDRCVSVLQEDAPK